MPLLTCDAEVIERKLCLCYVPSGAYSRYEENEEESNRKKEIMGVLEMWQS